MKASWAVAPNSDATAVLCTTLRIKKSGITYDSSRFKKRFECVIEAVAHAWDSQDELRSLRHRFDFLAQLRYVDMQAVGSGVRLVPPHLFQEHLPRENLAPVDDEY